MPDVSTLQSVADLRGSVFAKGKADRDDFVHALEWNGEDSPDYRQLLADVAVDLFIDQADPPQYISLETADWLIARIKAHTLSYAAKIQLLSALMQYAVSLPSSLSSFLLGEVAAAVVDGQPGHPAGRLDAADVEALRRALYAADDGASLHVTRAEAEILFRIAHSCVGKAIDPGFDDLFAKAVGNHLMAIAFRGATPVADKLALEKFENAPSSVGGFLRGMVGLSLPSEEDLESPIARDEAIWRARNDEDARLRAQSEKIDQDETIWLYAHLTRRGDMTSAERRLLEFLKQEVVNPPAGLADLFRKAGV